MRSGVARLGAGEFFGGVTRRAEVSGLLLSETRHAPHQVIPPHAHEPAHFCLALEGACTERIRGRDVECVPGMLEFHPAGTQHSSTWAASGGRCFTITLGPGWLSRLEECRAPHPAAGVLGPASRDLATRLYREIVSFDASSAMVIEGLALALLGASSRATRTATRGVPPWLSDAEEYLRTNHARPLRVQAVADAVHAPAVQLGRWFRRAHGCTVGEFVRTLRVEHAERLLATSRMTITDIAFAVGFADHAHLTRTFRRLRQLTPSEFRRSAARTATGKG